MRHSSFVEVNLSFLGENVERIKKLAPAAKLIPMVKADAYGNGLHPIVRFLAEECSIRNLGCATLGEALSIVEEFPKIKSNILVFSDAEFQDEKFRDAYLNLNITPVLHDPRDLNLALTLSECKRMPIVIKLNTGMNRLGFTAEDLIPFIPKLKSRGIKHLMTHFSCSYYALKAGDKTHRQMSEFERIRKVLTDAGVSIEETSVANSGAIEQGFGISETYVRPGLMLYGPPSVEPRIWDGHQISRLVTKVLKTFQVKKGTPLGYGINVAGEDYFTIIVAMGYGDGLTTYASGTNIKINGYSGKIFARVNMDMAYIVFDPKVEGKIKVDDKIEIWGNDNRVITDLATQMKTIPYQLMCGISSRIPRVYKVK